MFVCGQEEGGESETEKECEREIREGQARSVRPFKFLMSCEKNLLFFNTINKSCVCVCVCAISFYQLLNVIYRNLG